MGFKIQFSKWRWVFRTGYVPVVGWLSVISCYLSDYVAHSSGHISLLSYKLYLNSCAGRF